MKPFKNLLPSYFFFIQILFLITTITLGNVETEGKSSLTDEEFDKYCSLNLPESPAKSIELPFDISYFISPNPDGTEVAVINTLGAENRLIDLTAVNDGETLQEEMSISIPGVIDPVFTPDGLYVTIPTRDYFTRKIEFISLEEIKLNKDLPREEMAKLKADITAGRGNPYQSVGQPTTNEYNYISDPSGISSESYKNLVLTKITHRPRALFKKRKVEKITLCKNQITGHLPMISKDGEYISYLDTETHTTKVMRIGRNGDECKEVLDLGIPTGKVSFNFDRKNRQLAFHVERSNSQTSWFPNVKENFSTDIFVANLDVESEGEEDEKWSVNEISRLTNTTQPLTGTYYPRFTRNGDIIAAKTTLTPSFDEYYQTSNIVVFNADQFKPVALRNKFTLGTHNPNIDSCKKEEINQKMVELGKLYTSICENLQIRDRKVDSLLVAPFIGHQSCISLIEDFYEKSPSPNFTPEDLIGICPEEEGEHKKKSFSYEVKRKQLKGHELFKDKCSTCHLEGYRESGGIAFFDGAGVNTENGAGHVGLTEDIARRSIESLLSDDVIVSMPPADMYITMEEKKEISRTLLDYIKDDQLKKEMTELIELSE